MKEKLMNCYLKGKAAVTSKVRNFMSEERGASDIVAVVVLIVIIIAAAVIFRRQLILAVEGIMDDLDDFIG